MKYEEPAAERQILAGVGLYIISLGIVFSIIAARASMRVNFRVPTYIFMLGAAREFIVGVIVVLCAYLCRPERARLISVIAGLALLALIAVSVFVFGQFTFWTVLRILGAVLLVALGASFARRARG